MHEMDHSLDTLLALHGEEMNLDGGFTVKFDVKRVSRSKHRPHGIKYSLTLHFQKTRIFGVDNAHEIILKQGRKRIKSVTWDHEHKRDRINFYEYTSAGDLLEYFWEMVNEIMKETIHGR